MTFPVAERFKAPQGEGLFAGTMMAFVRLVGCSVGKGICTHCDTEFSAIQQALGGGIYTVEDLLEWTDPYEHVCLTGGEPLDRDLTTLVLQCQAAGKRVHVETSGTKRPAWLHDLYRTRGFDPGAFWLTVSPKPGYLEEMVREADEVKVILGGLGDGPGWPSVSEAVRWAAEGRLVYLQPRNDVLLINRKNLAEVVGLCEQHPTLRISSQLHKLWGCR